MVQERPGNSRASDPEGGDAAGSEPEDRQAGPREKGVRSPLPVQPRRERYMVTPLPLHLLPPGVPELSFDAVCDRLDRMPEVKVTRRLQPSEKLRPGGLSPARPEIAVAEAAEAQVPAMRSLHLHISSAARRMGRMAGTLRSRPPLEPSPP